MLFLSDKTDNNKISVLSECTIASDMIGNVRFTSDLIDEHRK